MLYSVDRMKSYEKPTSASAFQPESPAACGDDRKLWDIGILLLFVVPMSVLSLLAPRFSPQAQLTVSVLPQLLLLLATLLLMFNLHLAAQRKLQHQTSTALAAATSYVDRLEQFLGQPANPAVPSIIEVGWAHR